jgi:hypothetical protein
MKQERALFGKQIPRPLFSRPVFSRRAAMIAELKVRVAAGTYHPNLDVVAERMLTVR